MICLKKCAFAMMACFLFSTAFAKPTTGVFMVVKGDVKVKKANLEVLKAKVTLSVGAGDTVISGSDSRAKIVMEDKNIIHISPNTELKIETYVNNGAQKNVELHLKEGKVRNNVEQSYDGDKNKFIIKTPTAVAGVRGTQFITSFDKISNQTKIVTLQGRVELSNIPNKPGIAPTTVVINKGETSSASAEQAPAAPQPLPFEQIKTMDRESTGAATDSSAKKDTINDAPMAKDSKKTRTETRVEDKQDQSPQTFDKLPDIKNTAPGVAAPAPAFQPPRPPINNLPGDAIRQQNEKTKVKIIPQSTTSP